MRYTRYQSPLGTVLLAADETGLTGLRFEEQKYFPDISGQKNSPVLKQATKWLNIYFSGQNPDFTPPLHMIGTDFQLAIWNLLLQIPYGGITTYGTLAREIAVQRNSVRVSARAVGGAVGKNPISIIIPCHRVIGSDGGLTGYAGGIDRKQKLLILENAHYKIL